MRTVITDGLFALNINCICCALAPAPSRAGAFCLERLRMRKLRPRFGAQNGMRFPFGASCGKRVPEFGSRVGCTFRLELQTESASRNPRLEWDALSGTALNRKLRPRISLQNGIPFPAEPSGGKFIPELTLGVGYGFRMEPQRKLRPSLSVYSGMQFPLGASTGKSVPF